MSIRNVPIPSRCLCGVTWASPTPPPICPEHGLRYRDPFGHYWTLDEAFAARDSVKRFGATYTETPEVM